MTEEKTIENENQLVCFKLGKEEFGLDIMKVQEIIKVPEITKVPRTPSFVQGALNLRGKILPVVDLRTLFDLEETERNESNRIVVVNIKGKTTGIIVDSVSEVLRLPKNSIEPPPPIVSGIQAQFLEGVGKLKDGKRLVILLNLDKILKVTKEDEQTYFEVIAKRESLKAQQAQYPVNS